MDVQGRKQIPVEILAAVLGAVVFLCIYGVRVLNPFYVDYLLTGGDLSQHYLGWELFREGDWRPMAGLTDAAAYPYSTSVIFTDSIPIFSLLFKIIFGFYKKPFQFFGIWGIMCFSLQGFFAAKLIKSRIDSKSKLMLPSTLFLTLLFLLCPFFIRRMFWHSALAGQFVILIAIYLFDNTVIYSRKYLSVYWIILGILTASIHIYFIAMCGVILFGALLYRLIYDIKEQKSALSDIILDIFCPLFGYCFWAVFTIYFLGGFNSNMEGGAPGIGYYSFNLNGLFNADDGYSRFLSALPFYADGQYEGDAYLGLGALLLIVAVIGALIFKAVIRKDDDLTKKSNKRSYIKPLCVAVTCVILVILAASNEVTFNDKLLFKFPLPEFIEKLYSPLRSSGRLIWPVGYFLILESISTLGNIYKAKTEDSSEKSGPVILCLIALSVFALQLVDISPKLSEIGRKYNAEQVYINPVTDQTYSFIDEDGIEKTTFDDILTNACAKMANNLHPAHLVFLDKDKLSQEELYGFTYVAINNNMTVNDFYFARFFNNRAGQIAVDYALSGRDDCVYIYKPEDEDMFNMLPFYTYHTENFVVAIPE